MCYEPERESVCCRYLVTSWTTLQCAMNKKPIVSAVEQISRKGYAYLAGSSSCLEGAVGNVSTFACATAHYSFFSLR